MRVLFSVYSENHDTGEQRLHFSKYIETNLSIAEIDGYLQLYDGFHSALEVGQDLCFWDIYCFFADLKELEMQINRIPSASCSIVPYKVPNVLIIEEFDPGNTDAAFYPDIKKCFSYRITRYECGASSYDAIVMFASNHPWLMVFIGGAIWDIAKGVSLKLCKWLKHKCGLTDKYGRQKRVACFSVKRFYHNFEKITKIPQSDCQIVFLNRRRSNIYEVRVRTVTNECYVAKSSSRGKIDSIKPININDLTWR